MRRLIFPLLPLVFLFGCKPEAPQQTAPASAPPPPAVTVARVPQLTLQGRNVYTGRLEAPEYVELRPRVSGYLEEALIVAGSRVKTGDILFRIDTRSFEAEVNRLRAEVRSAEARLKQTESDRQRAQKLRAQGAIAVEQFEARNTAVLEAEANLESLKAALAIAELNLSFATVRAPIDGRLSRALVTPGNYVTAGQTVLTTVVSTGNVDAYFDMDESAFLELRQGDTQQTQVNMVLSDGSAFPTAGKIDFIDNTIDPTTGTIRMRARFSDPNGQLTPGQFVRLQVASGEPHPVLVVQEKAIGTDLANRYVLMVDDKSTLQYRPIQLGRKLGSLRVIEGGLQAGEQVVIRGQQKAFPGMPVQAEVAPMVEEAELQSLGLSEWMEAGQ